MAKVTRIDELKVRNLCARYKAGEDVIGELIEELRPIINGARKVACTKAPPSVKAAISTETREDIESDIIENLLTGKAIRKYDPANGSAGPYFLTVMIRAAMNSLAKTTRSDQYMQNETALSSDETDVTVDVFREREHSDLIALRMEWNSICNHARRFFPASIVDYWEQNPQQLEDYLVAKPRTKDALLKEATESLSDYSTTDIERVASAITLYIRYRFDSCFDVEKQIDSHAISADEIFEAVRRFYPEIDCVLSRLGEDQRLPVLVALSGMRVHFPSLSVLRGSVSIMRMEYK